MTDTKDKYCRVCGRLMIRKEQFYGYSEKTGERHFYEYYECHYPIWETIRHWLADL